MGLRLFDRYLLAIGLHPFERYLLAMGLRLFDRYLLAIGLRPFDRYLLAIGLRAFYRLLDVVLQQGYPPHIHGSHQAHQFISRSPPSELTAKMQCGPAYWWSSSPFSCKK